MNVIIRVLISVALVALPAFGLGQNDERSRSAAIERSADGHVVSVDFPSYLSKTDALDVLRGYWLRESVVLALKLRGIPVRIDGVMRPEALAQSYRAPEDQFRGGLGVLPDLVISIEHLGDGRIDLVARSKKGNGGGIASGLEETSRVNVGPADDLWRPSLDISEGLTPPAFGKLLRVSSTLAERLLGTGSPEAIDWVEVLNEEGSGVTVLNAPWPMRLLEMNRLLDEIEEFTNEPSEDGDESATVATLFARLARFQAIHACHHARADDSQAFRYAGMALVSAAAATRLSEQGDPRVAIFEAEIRALIERLVCRLPVTFPAEPLLSELGHLKEREEWMPAKGELFPDAENLFDYLLIYEVGNYVKGYEKAAYERDFRTDSWGVDGIALAWGHSANPFTASSWFLSFFESEKEGDWKNWFVFKELSMVDKLLGVGAPTAAEPDLEDCDAMLVATENFPERRLPGGREQVAGDGAGDYRADFLKALGILQFLSQPRRIDTLEASSTALMMGWQDIRRETISRHASLTRAAAERLMRLGDSEWEEIKELLFRFGDFDSARQRRFSFPIVATTIPMMDWEWLEEDVRRLRGNGYADLLAGLGLAGEEPLDASERLTFSESLARILGDVESLPPGVFAGLVDQSLVLSEINVRRGILPPEELPEIRRQMLDQAFPGVFIWPTGDKLWARNQRERDRRYAVSRFWERRGKLNEVWDFVDWFLDDAEKGSKILERAFFIAARTGKLDQARERFRAICTNGFGRDDQRLRELFWDGGGDFDPFLSSVGTNSARDYLARLESCFRTGRHFEGLAAARQYHYGANPTVHLYQAMYAAVENGAESREVRANLESSIEQWLSTRDFRLGDQYNLSGYWHDRLAQLFSGDPEWHAFTKRSGFDRAAWIQRGYLTALSPDTGDLVADVLAQVSAEARAVLEEEGRISRSDIPQIFELEHDLLARMIADQTDRLARDPDEPLLRVCREVAGRSAEALSRLDPEIQLSFTPLPLRFLALLGTEGCPGDRVGDLAARLALAGAPLSPGDLMLAECLKVPSIAKVILSQQDLAMPSNGERISSLVVDPWSLYHLARARGESEAALACALEAASRGELALLMPYFKSENEAIAWIERNAPSAAVGGRWRERLEARFAPGSELPKETSKGSDLSLPTHSPPDLSRLLRPVAGQQALKR